MFVPHNANMGRKKKSKTAITSMETINGIVIKYMQGKQKCGDYQLGGEDKINNTGLLDEPLQNRGNNNQSGDSPSLNFNVVHNLTSDNSCRNQPIKTCNDNTNSIIPNRPTPSLTYYQRNDKQDDGYIQFEVEFLKTKNPKYNKINESIFNLNRRYDYSYAHFTTEDLNMDKHTGFYFDVWRKDLGNLLDQKARPGDVAVLSIDERKEYYLVTKRESSNKHTYEKLFMALRKLSQLVKKHNVRKLAIPKLEYVIDGLDLDKVKFMMEYLFKDYNIKIAECNFKEALLVRWLPTMTRKSKIINLSHPVSKIDNDTIILYLASEDGYITNEIEDLNRKFNFLDEFKKSPKTIGTHILTSANRKKHILFGCVARKTIKDDVCFVDLEKSILELQKWNDNKRYKRVAFQAIKDKDPLINNKIVNVLRNDLKNVTIYVCWTGATASV